MNVLKAWIDKHFEDFEADEHLEKALVEFLTCNKTHHYYQQNSEDPSSIFFFFFFFADETQLAG